MNERPHIKGFVDLQVNGFKGVNFSSLELTEDAVIYASRQLEKKGIVAFLPTIITCSPEVYQKNLMIIAKIRRYNEFKNLIPGIHLEGPFISREDGYRGIHPADHIQEPDIDFLKNLVQWSDHNIRLITIAAEKTGADKLAAYARSKNIIVSLGHQQADEKQIEKLRRKGARVITHLGNGIPHLIDRHTNPIWGALGNNDLATMIITDGFHLPVSLIKTIIKVKGIGNTVLVSDISPLGGLKPGDYKIWGSDVTLLPNGFLYNPSTGYLAGSSRTLLDCVNYILQQKIARLNDVYRMAFFNPLRLLGISPAKYKSTKTFNLRNNKIVCK